MDRASPPSLRPFYSGLLGRGTGVGGWGRGAAEAQANVASRRKVPVADILEGP